ncbi:hypothetical protein [Roseimaritima multifibrata]|uniref:hypothetical protein n=1 Tax=Roseimaritima multifibrata TaxID=1930274 RepID=UPI00119F7131|nr:hypothetical protein [Roseimaritima multifibrata]
MFKNRGKTISAVTANKAIEPTPIPMGNHHPGRCDSPPRFASDRLHDADCIALSWNCPTVGVGSDAKESGAGLFPIVVLGSERRCVLDARISVEHLGHLTALALLGINSIWPHWQRNFDDDASRVLSICDRVLVGDALVGRPWLPERARSSDRV